MRLSCRVAALFAWMLAARLGHADPATAGATRPVDRVAVRYHAPETGGVGRPRFITERVLAFETRLEALGDERANPARPYEDVYVRAAIDSHVAEDALAALMFERGTEPPNMAALVDKERFSLIDRAGSAEAFDRLVAEEGLTDQEVTEILRRRVRAAYYVDRAISPILRPSENDLRQAFRQGTHPYRGAKFEEIHDKLQRWLVGERLRGAEGAFLQTARSRMKVVILAK